MPSWTKSTPKNGQWFDTEMDKLDRWAEDHRTAPIETLQVLAGRLPRRALSMTIEWTANHQAELRENWALCRQHKQPRQMRSGL